MISDFHFLQNTNLRERCLDKPSTDNAEHLVRFIICLFWIFYGVARQPQRRHYRRI